MPPEMFDIDIASLFTNATLVIITGIYCFLTYKIARSNRHFVSRLDKQLEAEYRPYIVIRPELREHLFVLIIENSGNSTANDLQLTISKDFFILNHSSGDDKNLRMYRLFNSTITDFAPKQHICLALASGMQIFGDRADPNGKPLFFDVNAKYRYNSKIIEEKTEVDLRPYLMSYIENDISKHVKNVCEEIKNVRKELRKMRDILRPSSDMEDVIIK
jgi:hypothetical protein